MNLSLWWLFYSLVSFLLCLVVCVNQSCSLSRPLLSFSSYTNPSTCQRFFELRQSPLGKHVGLPSVDFLYYPTFEPKSLSYHNQLEGLLRFEQQDKLLYIS